MSFALEMTMAPRVGLEVSPALVAFGELLTLPCAAMQSVVERELCANPALERLDAGECPICRGSWRKRCPVCSVPARGRPAEPRRRGRRPGGDRAGRRRLCCARCGWRPAPPTPPSPSASSTASTSMAVSTGRAPRSPPSWASPNRRWRPCSTSSGAAGRPESARPASPNACCSSSTRSTSTTTAPARPRRHRRSPAGAGEGPLHVDRQGARRVTRRGPAGPRAHPAAPATVSGVRRQGAAGLPLRRPGRGRERAGRRLHRRAGGAGVDEAGGPAVGRRRGLARAVVPGPAPRPLEHAAARRRVHGRAAAGVPGGGRDGARSR